MSPTQGTDAALAMTMGHVILKEYHVTNKSEYFTNHIKQYTDMPFLVILEEKEGVLTAGRTLRASDIDGALGEKDNTEWKPLLIDGTTNEIVVPTGTVGFRWDGSGK